MLPVAAAICLSMPQPSSPYAGEPPALRGPKPELPASATSAAGFAPPGWKVERTIEGDLNGDSRSDLVAILKGADPACIVQIGESSRSMDTNPRMVVVAFGGTAGFNLHLVNPAIIPRVDDPYMDDPLDIDGLAIRGNVLRLRLAYWRSMGGWATYSSTLSFRWDGTQFRLIGFDRETLRRNTGEMESLSVNFATGRARVATGSTGDDIDDTARWQRIPVQKTKTLATMGDGLAYEPKLVSSR